MSVAFFYDGGGRRAALDALFESIHRADPLVLVEGASGCGRSALLDRFRDEADPDVLAIGLVGGDILMSASQCLAALAQALGAVVAEGVDEREALLGALAMIREAGRLPVLVIDDAHELGEETLHAALAAGGEAGVTLVLAGDETLGPALGDAPAVRIALRAFREEETEDFVAGWLAVDDEDELPSHRAMTRLHRQAQGMPGALVALLEAGAAQRGSLLPAGFPVWHVALAAVAVVVLLVLLARMDSEPEAQVPVVAEIPVALPAPGEGDATPAEGVVPQNRAVAVAVPRPVVVNGSLSPEEPPATPVALPSPPAGAPAVPTAPVATPAEPKVVPVPVSEPQKAVRRYTADEEAILRERAARHTLQLFASFNEDAVRQFRAKHAAAGIRTFRTVREDLPWYVAVTGSYRNKDEARAAVAGLPADLQKLKPWPRSFQGIQDELRRRKD